MIRTNVLQACLKGALITALQTAAVFGAGFFEDWDGPNSSNFYYASGGNKEDFTHTIGATSTIEPDTKILSLKTDPNDNAGAYQGPNMGTNNLNGFGTYAARIKVPDASVQPNVGVVVGFFTYYNDEYSTALEADYNNNGLYDNSEIDFEWLIADPTVVYITAYTDYHAPTGEARKVGRILNLAEGVIYKTEYAEALGGTGTKLTGKENMPETIDAIPGYDASKQFYTYGFDWYSDQIRWWMLHPETNDTIVLWDYQGPQERITQKPATLMLNIWHTNGWSVHTKPGTTEAPEHQFEVEFDWVSFTPEGDTKLSEFAIGTAEGTLLSDYANNSLSISAENLDVTKAMVHIYDMSGRHIQSIIDEKGSNETSFSFPTGTLSNGCYIWQMETGSRRFSGRFIK